MFYFILISVGTHFTCPAERDCYHHEKLNANYCTRLCSTDWLTLFSPLAVLLLQLYQNSNPYYEKLKVDIHL